MVAIELQRTAAELLVSKGCCVSFLNESQSGVRLAAKICVPKFAMGFHDVSGSVG